MTALLPDAEWRHRPGLDGLLTALGAEQGLARYVGGAVRDGLLGLPVNDLDIATALEPQQVVDRLKPLAVEGAPWFGSAGELVAISYMKMRKPDLAGPLFAAMAKDATVPQSIRSRARQMAGLLGIDAVETPTVPGQG